MKRLKDLIREEPVHQRLLEFRTYPSDDNRVIVEGRLKDDRLVEGFSWDGVRRPAGNVHWMYVWLLVGDWPLTILDAEVEMPGVPRELCRTMQESVKKIVGLSIVSGFSERVRRRLGGVKGCTHLTYMITAMGPAVLHGYWAQRSRRQQPMPRSLKEFPGINLLKNSCALWSEDGPLVREITEKLNESEGGRHEGVADQSGVSGDFLEL